LLADYSPLRHPHSDMTTEERLAASVATALAGLEVDATPADVQLSRPQRPEHGDWATNVALVLGKANGRPPRLLAEQLAAALLADPPKYVEEVEVAGPGFVNFR